MPDMSATGSAPSHVTATEDLDVSQDLHDIASTSPSWPSPGFLPGYTHCSLTLNNMQSADHLPKGYKSLQAILDLH